MNLLLVIEADRSRAWMKRLAERLDRLGARVRAEIVPPTSTPVSGVEMLLELERLVMRRQRAIGAEPIASASVAPAPGSDFTAQLVIDLTEQPTARRGAFTLAPAWNGVHGENAAIHALLSGTTPLCEIVEVATGASVERGLASLETASGLGGAIDSVAARLVTLLEAQVKARLEGRERPRPPQVPGQPPGQRRDVARIAATSLAGSLARAVYRLTCHAPHWRVGWRLHEGPGIAETGGFSGPLFNVLADPGHRFFADPFPAIRDGKAHVFVEDLDHRVGKGIISAIPFDEHGPCGEAIPVLEEPWHLSYPFLIEHDGVLHMIPESSNARDVALYACVRYPDRWERVATLLDDISLSDATVFEDGGRWWMFGTRHDGEGGWSDVLALFSAPTLRGPWTAHPGNPVLVDRTSARPAGAMFHRDGRLWRPVQDCTEGYGAALALAEVTRLDDGGFEQVVRHRLGTGPQWPGRKLHTLNRAGPLEVIDGAVIRPKWPWIAGFVERATAPRRSAP